MDVYSQLGWQCSWLGPPLANLSGQVQYFEYGYIEYFSSANCWEAHFYPGFGYDGYNYYCWAYGP